MAPFSLFFDVLGPVEVARFSKSSYPSGGSPQLGCERRFLAATSTRAEPRYSPKTCFVQGSMAEHTEALWKTATSNFVS